MIVPELSDFRLKTLSGLCRHNESVIFFLFCASENLHLLLFAVYKANVEEQSKNCSAVVLFLMSSKDRRWLKSARALNALRGCATSSLPRSWGFSCLYSRTATIWCSGVSLGHCQERAVRVLWGGTPPLPLGTAFRLTPLLLMVPSQVSVFYAYLCLDPKILFSKQKTTKTLSNRSFYLLLRQISRRNSLIKENARTEGSPPHEWRIS